MHDEQHHGGTKATYNMVFGVLFILTIIEVIIGSAGLASGLSFVLLLTLALGKASLVVSFYMHLKYDRPLYTWVLIIPCLMGTGIILSLQGLAGY